MFEFILSIIAMIVSVFSLVFSIYTYKKALPKLRFIFYNSRYHFPIKDGKMDSPRGKFYMEMLVTNSGQKEISIIDIFPLVKQVSEINVYKGDELKPIVMLKDYSKKEVMKKEFGKKQHIPISNCERLRIELSFKVKSQNERSLDTGKIWEDIHNKGFIFITSDKKKYKVNAKNMLIEYPKELKKLHNQ